jgi:hypothetical protein
MHEQQLLHFATHSAKSELLCENITFLDICSSKNTFQYRAHTFKNLYRST